MMDIKDNPILAEALKYMQKGWSIIPIKSQTKKPFIDWKPYKKRKATEEEIEDWWTKWSDAGVAVILGKISGIVVIDIDSEQGEKMFLDSIGMFPDTPIVRTSRGRHFYFKYSENMDILREQFDGFEIRGDGHYTVLPPSVHPTGVKYQWETPLEVGLSDLPKELSKMIDEKKSQDLKEFPENGLTALIELISKSWRVDYRHELSLGLSGYLAKQNIPWPIVQKIIEGICEKTNDEETPDRMRAFKDTHRRIEKGLPVKGYTAIERIIPKTDFEELEQLVKDLTVPPLMSKIDQLRICDEKVFIRLRRISETAVDSLRAQGQFIYTSDKEKYFFRIADKKVIAIEDEEMSCLLDKQFGLNPIEKETKHVNAYLFNEIIENGIQVEVFNTCFYNAKKNQLYIDRMDGTVYKLDGVKIKIINNGEDGVVFKSKGTCEQINADLGHPLNPMKYLIDDINFDYGEGVSLSIEQQKLVFWLWCRSFFFIDIQPTKPILTLTGEKGSGKTTAIRRWAIFLYGKKENVVLPKNLDGLYTALSNQYLVILDNIDDKFKGLANVLNCWATGVKIVMRKYYTNKEQSDINPRCFIVITTVNPPFEEDTVADRMIILKMKRRQIFRGEGEIVKELDDIRDKLWGGMLIQLNKDISRLSEQRANVTDFRMADFANLILNICDDSEKDIIHKAIDGLKRHQNNQMLETSPIPELITISIKSQKIEIEEEYSARDLHDIFDEVCKQNNIRYRYPNAKALGRHLSNIKDALESEGILEFKKMNNKYLYTILKGLVN